MSIFDNGLESVRCSNCGVVFGTPNGFIDNRRHDKREFFCPNGHPLSYRESVSEKLQRELNQYKQREAMLLEQKQEQVNRALKAERQVKGLKKRASAGTCPCCSRTFANMAEHMKTQHPELIQEGGAKVVPIKRAAR